MGVLAHQAIGQFIGVGLAGEIGTGIQQTFEGGRRRLGGRMAGEPIGIAASRLVPGDVEHVLGAEIEAAERPRRRALERDMGFPAERPEFVVQDIRRHG